MAKASRNVSEAQKILVIFDKILSIFEKNGVKITKDIAIDATFLEKRKGKLLSMQKNLENTEKEIKKTEKDLKRIKKEEKTPENEKKIETHEKLLEKKKDICVVLNEKIEAKQAIIAENPHIKAQTETDASFSKKRNQGHFGFKMLRNCHAFFQELEAALSCKTHKKSRFKMF